MFSAAAANAATDEPPTVPETQAANAPASRSVVEEPGALDCIPNMIGDIETALNTAIEPAAVVPAVVEPPLETKPTGVVNIAGGYFKTFTSKLPSPSIPDKMKKMPTIPKIAIPNVKTSIQPRSG